MLKKWAAYAVMQQASPRDIIALTTSIASQWCFIIATATEAY
jgi:hypothetical protein